MAVMVLHAEADITDSLCAQLGPKLRTDTLQCVTFATPPVVTRDVAIACEDYVTTVVHRVNRHALCGTHRQQACPCPHAVIALAGHRNEACPSGGTR